MRTINEYKNRFNQLMESTIGDVKPLITEQPGEQVTLEQLPQEIQNFVKKYGLTGTFNQVALNGVLGKVFGYNKGIIHSALSVGDVNTYETKKSQYNKCVERRNRQMELAKSINMREPDGRREVIQTLDSEFPNMDWCGSVKKAQDIINLK